MINVEDLLTPEELAELQPDPRPDNPVDPSDQPTEALSPGFKKKLRQFVFLVLFYGRDGKFTPREKARIRGAGREIFDELFR